MWTDENTGEKNEMIVGLKVELKFGEYGTLCSWQKYLRPTLMAL